VNTAAVTKHLLNRAKYQSDLRNLKSPVWNELSAIVLRMKTTHVAHWLVATAIAVSLAVSTGGVSGRGIGGFEGGGPHGSFQHGSDRRFASRHDFGGHRFVIRDRFFHNHRRFFVAFDFVVFGFPIWWYPHMA
jgi:hypothetical protein